MTNSINYQCVYSNYFLVNDDSEESDAPRRKKSRKVWSETESESDESWGRRKKYVLNFHYLVGLISLS